MKAIYVLVLVVSSILVSSLVGYGIRNDLWWDHSPKVQANMKFTFETNLSGSGEVERHNTVTTQFLQYIVNDYGYNNNTAKNDTLGLVRWISLGNMSDGASAASRTNMTYAVVNATFTAGGRTGGAFAVSRNLSTVWNVTVTFRFTTGGSGTYPVYVNATSAEWDAHEVYASTAAWANLSPVPAFNSGDNCTIQWNFAVSGT